MKSIYIFCLFYIKIREIQCKLFQFKFKICPFVLQIGLNTL